MSSPRPLSVREVAEILGSSDAYVRRLLLSQRLFGVKVGPVWAVYPNDLESFQRMRRQPGRPPKSAAPAGDDGSARRRIEDERDGAHTDDGRLKPRRR